MKMKEDELTMTYVKNILQSLFDEDIPFDNKFGSLVNIGLALLVKASQMTPKANRKKIDKLILDNLQKNFKGE